MNFIGDIHGKYDEYLGILSDLKGTSIQVGDLGIGFKKWNPQPNHFFIHGNHDCPELCTNHSDFLGRYGYTKIEGKKIFYVSGALSIDKHLRFSGIDWWESEQLSWQEGNDVLGLYQGADIVVSHDCPISVYHKLGVEDIKPSRTAELLEAMFVEHEPKLWVFGHHHQSARFFSGETKFICLDELEVLII